MAIYHMGKKLVEVAGRVKKRRAAEAKDKKAKSVLRERAARKKAQAKTKGKSMTPGELTPGEYEPRKSRPYSKRKSTAKKYPAGSAKKQAIHNTKKAAIPGWLGHSLYDEKANRILRERDHKDLRPSERTPTESNPAKDQKTKGKK